MKPFNLEEAKAGKPVCTGDGKDVTIIKYDLRGKYPLLAIINRPDADGVNVYTSNGRYWDNMSCPKDLFMKSEKKIGWINLIPWFNYARVSSSSTMNIYITRQAALDDRDTAIGYIGDPIQIEWEE